MDTRSGACRPDTGSIVFNLWKLPRLMGITPDIFIIGAGGIVHDAHLPAYALAGFDVSGIFDVQGDKAARLAHQFSIPKVFSTLEEMISEAKGNTIFDVAVP